jgi:predicted ATP-grasp superfamily ATP-dependent carboligase
MPKSILVLGAGVYHIPLVQSILKLGHKAIATSFLKNDPALKWASVTKNISSTDVSTLSDLVKNEKIEAIATTASDWNTFSQAELNAQFHLNGVRPVQVHAVSEKLRFNQLLKKLALSHVSSEEVVLRESLFEAYKKQDKHIFKPLKGSGSADVFTTEDEFPQKLIGQKFLAQTFIEGSELGAQAIIENGQVLFLALSQKELVHNVVPFAHILGNQKVTEFEQDIKTQLEQIAAHLDFQSGTMNLDIRQSGSVLYIIDLSLRLSGNGLIEAINESYSVNLFEYHIQQIIEESRKLAPLTKPLLAASVVFGSAKAEKDLSPIRTKI